MYQDLDNLMVIGDIRHIQKLNGWDDNQVGGFELTVNDFEFLGEQTNQVYSQINYDLNAQSVKELNPQIFDWLQLQDINVWFILLLMIIVGSVNMVTAILILILERTAFIGILKTIGATNRIVRKVFLYNALFLILIGLFWGNLIGLGIAFLQQKFNLISLDPNIYFMDKVLTYFSFNDILLLNLGTLLLCWLMLFIPSLIITKIKPVKSIRFN